jgi:hypothetical protein
MCEALPDGGQIVRMKSTCNVEWRFCGGRFGSLGATKGGAFRKREYSTGMIPVLL